MGKDAWSAFGNELERAFPNRGVVGDVAQLFVQALEALDDCLLLRLGQQALCLGKPRLAFLGHVCAQELAVGAGDGHEVAAVFVRPVRAFPRRVAQVTHEVALLAVIAAHFRQRRLYGDIAFAGIPDRPADAIVARLGKLLRHLAEVDPAHGWDRYLEDGRPRWSRIAVAGQSQGGGMAEYLGKRETLARVLAFSGGWDHAAQRGKPAAWYADEPATPPERWYYAYHVEERFADQLAGIAEMLRLPAGHVIALDGSLSAQAQRSRMPGHGSSIHDAVYLPVWERMLGRGDSAP